MHLFYQPEAETNAYLSEEESRHCVKTLRLAKGAVIDVTDGRGKRHNCVIETADPRRCTFRVVDTHTQAARPYRIQLAVAPTKNMDRIEWLVEKSVELGIDQFSFFVSQHSERRMLKTDRLEKIAVAAMKQSLQLFMPVIDPLLDFKTVLTQAADERFIAHLPENEPAVSLLKAAKPGRTTLVLIGPEGDFSEREIQQAIENGFKMVKLGETRLRTETAALAACHTIHLINTTT
ncbi:16S rRNA (uracil(1498)-N(3))-methyltransferase [Larkinella humicola]|uniref:Ribosomal RNA small subunit methyltransferase E n=1 Tax=Larkinella humicola TaxID=2607654 RepID=A0A5N1JMI4_9BACT|nr:16S rRNA (uracil(1498)-N(3))-methyltransferase [Larkinella humicola]KAA9356647.1 16S rRNA (uracil(1498)-N(3))-methyltransferase [Larkinella humicola]